MTSWDADAQTRLGQVVEALRESGVVDLFERTVARVWKFNVDRHEVSEIGDTNRSLGITASENIRMLVMREKWSQASEVSLPDEVFIDAPNDSLVVKAAGVRIHVIKSPASLDLKVPRWDTDFKWQAESDVRLLAAKSNMEGYNPFLIGPGGLFEDIFPAQGSVGSLRETFLVWAGGSDGPFTAGWLGFPTANERPWLALEPLWWHGPGQPAARGGINDGAGPDADTFATREAPQPSVTLKRRDKSAEQ